MLLDTAWFYHSLHAAQAPYIITACVLIVLSCFLGKTSVDGIPVINPRQKWELTESAARGRFLVNAREMLRRAISDFPGRPFKVLCGFGDVIVLPAEKINEIRNDRRLKFTLGPIFYYPGFEGLNKCIDDESLFDVIKLDLTRHLDKMTDTISEETSAALGKVFSRNTEWHDIMLKQDVLQLIARVASRQFAGEELCRNEDWLRVSVDYTRDIFIASVVLRMMPPLLRPALHWILPPCRAIRREMLQARKIIKAVLERRRAEQTALAGSGEKKVYDDVLEWSEQRSRGGEHDPAATLIALSILALHTTTDLICRVLLDLSERPGLVDELRREMVRCLSENGWSKKALHDMKLLDSVIKESLRMDPGDLTSLSRSVLEDVTLSDGTVLTKGSQTVVPSYRLWDSSLYENPDTYDPYRFVNMRKTKGKEATSLLVTTTENFMAFGHGRLACPGRFFAANQIKTSLVHLLLKYDWRPAEGYVREPLKFDFVEQFDPMSKVAMRRRREEVDLDLFYRGST
ncbi:Cytochrome P450 monooygenase 1 [Colletotrichum orbiculare MAFF 240422]|uniref:Cytochrome P450 monooygenase 1 n=1 Tax=Colletotrichum orbiculare (strain 104-T / ATCC 96160 / CBS 514.97 / LARS 414 / MAFF 240422) TaxID=1213857 RepID=N4VK14_COLOR|nr:Cytochrome P450 monooygenase 1 [Colletotrichum orbiculare MAFF 240422]